MVEDWFKNFLQWRGFIADIIASYRSITRPVFEAILGWIPWDVLWLGDYFVFGLLFISCVFRGAIDGARKYKSLVVFERFLFTSGPTGRSSAASRAPKTLSWVTFLVDTVAMILLWPGVLFFFFLFATLRFPWFRFYENNMTESGTFPYGPDHFALVRALLVFRFTARRLFMWLGAVLLVLVVLLAMNSYLWPNHRPKRLADLNPRIRSVYNESSPLLEPLPVLGPLARASSAS